MDLVVLLVQGSNFPGPRPPSPSSRWPQPGAWQAQAVAGQGLVTGLWDWGILSACVCVHECMY